ncbi:MAG: CheR family methyltransferase [Myxococcota bacterium]
MPESFDHEFEELGRTLEWRGVRPDEAWCRTLIDRLTVRHTQWMRHPSQFERLERWLNTTISRPVLVWSAGCARGLEPLSIAEVAHRIGVECRILATDVSRAALAEARGAVSESAYRAVIEFRAHSIHGDLVPAESPFDLVFCRNVLCTHRLIARRKLSRAWADA